MEYFEPYEGHRIVCSPVSLEPLQLAMSKTCRSFDILFLLKLYYIKNLFKKRMRIFLMQAIESVSNAKITTHHTDLG